MRIPKDLDNAVSFACFAAREKMRPMDLAELLTLARKAFREGEKAASGERSREDAAGDAFERKARELGYETQWGGLWPTLVKNGESVFLPSL